MERGISVVVLVVAAIVQSTLLPRFAIFGVKIDLVLIIVIAWSIRRGVEQGLIWGVIGGVVVGWLSAEPFGVAMVGFCCAAVLAGGFGTELHQISAIPPIAVTPIAVIAADLASCLALTIAGWPVPWPTTVALVILPAAAVDSVAMLVVYSVITVIDFRGKKPTWTM